uniref:Uncharacterized protein n=1 Tax=Romanomermis culicivorax TaxID=13658 RepID=A0A915I6I3_ROMCU
MLSVRSKTVGGSDKVRTHMMFLSAPEKEYKKTRRTTNLASDRVLKATQQLQAVLQEKDVAIQTISQLDPRQWTGNQRVIHFGPMAQRDPFYYYYPKGWDILYPAHFGFFPYRTKKSRGSSPIVCLIAFGSFISAAAFFMAYLSFTSFSFYIRNVGNLQPLQVAAPILAGIGGLFLFFGVIWWISTLQLCSESLRHTQPHHVHKRRIYIKENDRDKQESDEELLMENSPFTPPPPIAVLENVYTDPSLYKPISEMKLFPPMIPGAQSTLSVARSNLSVISKPISIRNIAHNYTSGTMSTNYGAGSRRVNRTDSVGSYEYEAWPEYHASKVHYSSSGRSTRRLR